MPKVRPFLRLILCPSDIRAHLCFTPFLYNISFRSNAYGPCTCDDAWPLPCSTDLNAANIAGVMDMICGFLTMCKTHVLID
jgi:hypothetical protein